MGKEKEKVIVGCRVLSYTDVGAKAVKKNSKISIPLRLIIGCKVLEDKDFYSVEIKLKPKFFKNRGDDNRKRLVIGSAERLVHGINQEMIKYGCINHIDYDVEVIKE